MKSISENSLKTQLKPLIADAHSLIKQSMRPLVLALDGASGSGKSTIAQMIAQMVPASVIPLDDFFRADISDSQWDAFSIAERYENVLNWHKVRTSALEPLRNNRQARWYPFDFAAGIREDGTYPEKNEASEAEPSALIILEGAYSSSVFLADLLDLTVLVEATPGERLERLNARDGVDFSEDWHKRWAQVEAYYFQQLRPQSAFDWLIHN